MKQVLLVGAEEVGAKHLTALAHAPGLVVAGVADPAPRTDVPGGVPVFASWRAVLKAVTPDLVVVAAPPGTALAAARDAAQAGAAVLVEKPANTDPATLTPQPGDGRIFVAFQPHFAPGLDALLAERPAVVRAEVALAVRRDPGYFRGWRRTYTAAGRPAHPCLFPLTALRRPLEVIDRVYRDARVVRAAHAAAA